MMGRVVVMSSNVGGSLGEHFSNLDDPRRDQGKRHQLLDIIAMTICAVIGGAEGWSDVELFVQCKYEWFQRFLRLPHGVPCADTPAFARAGSLGGYSPALTRNNSGTASWTG